MNMRLLRAGLLGLLPILCLASLPAAAQPADQMQFRIINLTGLAAMVDNTPYIYASGVIDPAAPSRFQALVVADKLPAGSFLFFDSPGGNLLAGMELGREIRADGLDTYVNANNGVDNTGVPLNKPSLCASACTLAFLGGRFRFLDETSVYAVHRFYFPGNVDGGTDVAQIISAAVVQYMRDMGVDPQLFTLMTEAGESEVVIPTRQQLVDFNVVNDGAEKPVWTIESIPHGIYLKGEEDTVWGDNKLLFLCGRGGSMLLTAIFAARGRESLISAEHADGLLLDGQVVRTPPGVAILHGFNHGNAILTIGLNSNLMKKLLASHSVGVSMQFAYDAPTFDGIADIDFTDGLRKIGGFMTTCR
jgi:hypothetical protein